MARPRTAGCRPALVVDAASVVVVAGEDVVEDRVGLSLPGFGVIASGKLLEHVLDQYARRLARLRLPAPVEHEPIGDVLHQLARDLLDLRALLVGQLWVGLGQQVEHGKLGLASAPRVRFAAPPRRVGAKAPEGVAASRRR